MINKLNSIKQTTDKEDLYDDIAQSILAEHNRIRADPTSYIPLLELYLTYFTDPENDKVLYVPGQRPIETYDGTDAYKNAIDFLRKQKPLHTLTYDENISKASQDHVLDIGPKGTFTHDGSDGRSASDRIEKYIEWEVACCENLDMGFKTGSDVIINLLVDDGVLKKNHREHIFRPEFKYIGIAVGFHKEYETVCVIDYIGSYRLKGKPHYDPKTYKYEYPKELSYGFKQKDLDLKNKNKNIKPKTSFQLQDTDAPDSTVSIKTMKETRLYEGKARKVTKKHYDLDQGNYHVVEIEEI